MTRNDTLLLTGFGTRTEVVQWFCGHMQALNHGYDLQVYGYPESCDFAADYLPIPAQYQRDDAQATAYALAYALLQNRHYRNIIHIGSDCWIRDQSVIDKMVEALDRFSMVGLAGDPVRACFFGLRTEVLPELTVEQLAERLGPAGEQFMQAFARDLFARFPCASVRIPAQDLICYEGLQQAIICLEYFLGGDWESIPVTRERLIHILRFLRDWLSACQTRITLAGRGVNAAQVGELLQQIEADDFVWQRERPAQLWTLPGHPALDAAQGKRRFIFCINSGRSGSEYLARLLGTAAQVRAFHEPEPIMTGPYLRMAQELGLEASFATRAIKAQAVWQRLSVLPPGTIYAETSHMFIKTFADVVMAAFRAHEVDVVVLRRWLPAVLKSFVAMGYYSDNNPGAWGAWFHAPGAGHCAFRPPVFDAPPDQYDLAIGYLIDIEARARRFMEHYPQCRVHEVRLEGLQSAEQVATFFAALRLEAKPETARLSGMRVNDRSQRKAQFGIETTLEYCEQRIYTYLERCRTQGVDVPPLPQLDPGACGNS